VEAVPEGARNRRRRLLSRIPRSRRWALVAVALAPVVLAGCQLPTFGAFRGSTSQGQAAFKLWQFFFIAGLVVGGFVLLLILWAVFRYRRRAEGLPRQTQYHTPVEIMYTVVPILIVIALFVFTVITENEVNATPANPPLIVDLNAFQWGWQFVYPQYGVQVIGETTENPQMVIPAGENVQIQLRSRDVVHGFYVPAFNFSRYAQPGVLNTFDFNVSSPGVFRGQCTQFCGLYHSLMFFSVKAVSSSDFDTWVNQKQGTTSLASSSHADTGTKGGIG
jgi:cytochrome c oxidase subunit 2